MKILIIDNYDSFTYNLVQLLGRFEAEIVLKRNDDVTAAEIKALKPDKILLSPGPGRPENSNGSLTTIEDTSGEIPLLGVCLGHQAIGYVFGANIIHSSVPTHGKTSAISHDGKTIFRGISQNFRATRYHSFIIEKKSLPDELEISANTPDGIIMGIRHKTLPLEGIQFHPESILTIEGRLIIKNWLMH